MYVKMDLELMVCAYIFDKENITNIKTSISVC